MDINNLKKFCSCGGCAAKLPPGTLKNVLEIIPKFSDSNLLVGFDSSDDGAVYRLTDDLAIIQTLDFFPPMVEDPYTFGKIAAANSLSDIYAMGGDVKIALNIVCFPEKEDPAILAQILRGGSEKVLECGGVLCGGHSISDPTPKYGMSVTGVVHPDRILRNNTCEIGDKLILTKPLGVGIIMSAYTAFGEVTESYTAAVKSMETLNMYSAKKMNKYRVHACTDVTGFGFLGHLDEMITEKYTARVFAGDIPYISDALAYAREFILTAGGQKNRKFLGPKVIFNDVEPAMEEILFDPQTSGGLLISVHPEDAQDLVNLLNTLELKSALVGEIVPRGASDIIVEGAKA